MSSSYAEYIRLLVRGIYMKLGKGWFTRQLGERTRASRVRQLTRNERDAAQALRWVR